MDRCVQGWGGILTSQIDHKAYEWTANEQSTIKSYAAYKGPRSVSLPDRVLLEGKFELRAETLFVEMQSACR